MEYITSWERAGGLKCAREMSQDLLTNRFVGIDKKILERVGQLSIDQLHNLPGAIYDFTSIEDLQHWLIAMKYVRKWERNKGLEIVQRQLIKRLGNESINYGIICKLYRLEPSEVDDLTEALLDFQDVEDLEYWLSQSRIVYRD
jgi:hypothetical protein